MANVGKLTVTLTALTGRFGKGMKKASRTVSAFASEVATASTRLAVLSAGAATAAATAIGYLTHRQMEAIDVTAKVADRLGMSTEALLGYRHAADLAGVGVEEFDKSQEKLSKNLGNPSKDVTEALAKIGLSSTALLGMKPEDRFNAIADGIQTLGTQAEKAAVLTALFGKTGANLMNMMEGGSKAVKEMASEVAKLGYAYSRVDASKVEEANDSVTKLKMVFDGVFAKLAVEFSPLITELATKLLEFGSKGRSAADVIGEGVVNASKDMLRLIDIIDLLAGALSGIEGIWHSLSGAWQKASAAFKQEAMFVARGVGAIDDQAFAEGKAELTALNVLADESMAKAVEAFARSRKQLGEAIAGERSSAAKGAFDRIRAGADARAKSATAERAGRGGMQIFGDLVTKAIAKGNAIVAAANSSTAAKSAAESQVFIADAIKGIGSFFNSLPARAMAAGVRAGDPIDTQTSVRGSFSGETAGRMSSNLSLQTKQLEEQKKMAFYLQNIDGRLVAGVPIP